MFFALYSFLLTVLAQEPAPPPIDPEELRNWWTAAGELRMGESAYRVESLHFEEGVCAVDFEGGIMIPVYTGKAPVSERMVGFLYVGDGTLSVRFPERADAWSFANHMYRRAHINRDSLLPIALQQQPYTVKIDQGLLLSADPTIPKMIYNLNPIGGGLYFEENEEGEVDATYVVTEDRGKFGAQFTATNLLADRADYLERLGIDPRAMIRQDRLMHETLQFPGYHLRSLADFRTKQRFHVAAQEGTVLDSMAYDKWMTCFRDGRDESDTGFRSIAFSHGFDSDKRRHFQRFSGQRFPLDDNGEPIRPSLTMEAVFADSTVEFTPVRGASDQRISVESTLTLKAKGAPLQYVAMQLPTDGARSGSWELEVLELEDGRMLSWAGLNADLRYGGLFSQRQGQQNNQLSNQSLMPNTANQNNMSTTNAQDLGSQSDAGGGSSSGISEAGGGGIASAQTIEREDPFAATQLPITDQAAAEQEMDVHIESGFTYKILALLPEPVPAGETIKIKLKWSADLPFANLRRSETSEGVNVRSSGTTTGLRRYLPELLPSPGGTKWNFQTKIGAPARYSMFRSQSIVASGDTQRGWQDEGLWNWLEVSGTSSIAPAVGVGRWKGYMEPQAKGMPGVRVNMFPKDLTKAKQFPAEVRRVISFMERFLPSYPAREVEVVQDKSLTVVQSRYMDRINPLPGLVKLQNFSVTEVGRTGQTREENPHFAQEQIATQLAAQYWGQLLSPNSARDRWMSFAIPDAYANFYLRGVYGVEEYNKKMEALKKRIENPRTFLDSWKAADAKKRAYSQSGSTPYTDVPARPRQDYGFYVFAEMLRLRIGNQAFFQALDSVAENFRNKRVTTERVQQTLEAVSKQDLSEFFDFWIHGGMIPRLTVYTRLDKTEEGVDLFGCIESDLPFGIFDVPLRIKESEKSTDAIIKIIHGHGSFRVPHVDPKVRVELDPLGLLLSFERLQKSVDGATSCAKDPLHNHD